VNWNNVRQISLLKVQNGSTGFDPWISWEYDAVETLPVVTGLRLRQRARPWGHTQHPHTMCPLIVWSHLSQTFIRLEWRRWQEIKSVVFVFLSCVTVVWNKIVDNCHWENTGLQILAEIGKYWEEFYSTKPFCANSPQAIVAKYTTV